MWRNDFCNTREIRIGEQSAIEWMFLIGIKLGGAGRVSFVVCCIPTIEGIIDKDSGVGSDCSSTYSVCRLMPIK